MDLNKFMQAFGLLFVAIGTVVGLGFAVSGVVAGMGSLVFMGVCFLVLFCGIGGFFAWTGINNMNRERKINEKGYAVMGKIFDYVPDNQMTLNGQPTLSLIVRYKEDGIIKQAVVRTGQVDTAAFPRGATVTISLFEGEAALVPGSVSDVRLPDEENLLNPDIDPEKIHSSIGADGPRRDVGDLPLLRQESKGRRKRICPISQLNEKESYSMPAVRLFFVSLWTREEVRCHSFELAAI